MEEVLHANIFFFITSVAVVLFTLLLCVALFHLIKVLRTLGRIMNRIEEGTEVIAEDLEHVRAYLTEDGLFPRIMSSLMGTSSRARRQKAKKRSDLHIKDEA